MYRKTNKFKGKTRQSYMDRPNYEVRASHMNEGTVHYNMSLQAGKDLPKSTYSIKADPYTAANETSKYYNFIAPFNKTVGGSYMGESNIDGGNVQQYANSYTSSFLRAFDSMMLQLDINYRYLPITRTLNARPNRPGVHLVDEMRKAISEAVSVLQSTTFTNLAINNFAIATDLDLGSSDGTGTIEYPIAGGDPITVRYYTNTTDVIYGMSIYYQIFLQEVLSVMNYHNSFRLKQGVAIRDAWNREVPFLNSFFGLMNKKSFLNLLDGINLSFQGEFVDTDFAQQVNMITTMPSRRSDSMFDPLKEIHAEFVHPKIFKVYLLDDEGQITDSLVYDDAELPKTTYRVQIGVGEDNEPIFETITKDFWQSCQDLKDYLTIYTTKRWARQTYSSGTVYLAKENGRYNRIVDFFDTINAAFVKFKPKWADFRECLDIMTRTGTVSWTKGFRPAVVQDTDAPICQNRIVDDIYVMACAGNDTLRFNEDTKRWETYSLWNMYSGIPQYDMYQGGAFITFSCKDFANTITDNETLPYLPIMFSPRFEQGKLVAMLNRNGEEYGIAPTAVDLRDDNVLRRLAPLPSQSKLVIRKPTVTLSSLDDHNFAFIERCLLSVFGICCIDVDGSTRTVLDSDIVAVYQIEISDITNAAITYAREFAPFRGTTNSKSILGFLGTTRNSSK